MSSFIKNIFQRGPAEPAGQGGAGSEQGYGSGGGGVATMPSPFQAAGGQEPGGFGSSLFRTVGGESLDGAPLAAPQGGSPFSPFGTGSQMTLTVADLLPQLPPEMARANGAMPDQPVGLSPQVIEAAISSGQLAVPIFEVYRVCPALFQAPVSPHDPRMVPLPKGKLPGMIASHTGALKSSHAPMPQAPAGASPFAAMPSMPQAPASPFAPALPELPASAPQFEAPRTGPMPGTRPAGSLPPRRPQGMPPPIPTQADFVGAGPLSLQPQPHAMEPSAPASRPMFAPNQDSQPPAMNGGSPFAPAMGASPFGMPPAQPAGGPGKAIPGQTSLLFGGQPAGSDPELEDAPAARPQTPMGSPFGTPAMMPPPMQNSPFQPSAGMGSPFAAPAAGQSPFASPATSQNPFASPAGDPNPFAAPAANQSPFAAPGGNASPFAAPMQSPMFSPPPAHIESPPPMPSSFTAPPVASFEVPPRHVDSEPHKLGNLPFAAQSNPAPMISILPSASMPGAHTGHQPPSSRPMHAAPASRPLSGHPSTRPLNGAPASRPMYQAPKPAEHGGNESMEVSLAAVLKGQTAHDLGFDPGFIPGWITTKLPASEVRSQLATGQVVLDLGTIIDGTDTTFRSVIGHGKRDFKVNIPTSEVFQTMPPVAGGLSAQPTPAPVVPSQPINSFFAQPAPEQPAPAMGAFSPQFGAPSNPAPFAMPSAASAPASPPTRPMAQFPIAPASVAPQSAEFASRPMFASTPPAQDFGAPGMGSDQLFGARPPEPAPMFAAAAPAPAPAPPQTRPMFAAAPVQPILPKVEENPFAALAAEAKPTPSQPLQPIQGLQPMHSSRTPSMPMASSFAPAPAAAPSPAPKAAGNGGSSFGMSAAADDEQMVLRALLGVSDKLDAQGVVEHAAKLPGVCACACVRGLKQIAQGDGSAPANGFREQAAEISRSMRTLAGLTGIDAETLSITANDRLLTFCFQGENAFGVLHTSKEPPAGLREKVTLLSREISRMTV